MNKYKLNFLDPSLEKVYQKYNKPYMITKFYDYFKLQLFFMFVMCTLGLIKENFSLQRILALIGFCIFVVMFFITKRYLNKIIFETIIIIFCSGIGIIFVELMEITDDKGNVDISAIMLGLAFQFYLNIILLTRVSWIYSGALYFVNVAYLLGRLAFWQSKFKEEIMIGTTMLVINFIIISYRHEKTYRLYFKKLQESNDNLQKFKEIMQGILPNPIFILNYDENYLEFCNNSADKLLRKTNFSLNKEYLGEKKMFLSQRNLEESNKISLKKLENVMDSFTVLKEGLHSFHEKKPLMSELMKKFVFAKKQGDDFLENTVIYNEKFQTIHITNGQEDSDQITLLEEQNNQILFSKIKYYEVKLCNINWENKSCLLMIFTDQTKAKRLIELMNLDRYKNQMLATVSHDLRTPLNGVIGMMSSVLPILHDKESKKNLTIGIRSAYLLNYLINDILDFSQITYKKLRLNIERINIVDLVSEIFSLMKLQAKKKNLSFKREIYLNDLEVVYSDSARIKQILLNLLGNAIKFTKEGSIILKVESIDNEDSKTLRFSVIDTGIGIKPEDKDKLFVLFGKLKQENSQINKTGIGFGLTISQNLAKMLYSGEDAGILVETIYGKGSKFSFKIDVEKKEPEDFSFMEIEEKSNTSESVMLNLKRYDSNAIIEKNISSLKTHSFLNISLKILIVDDDPINVMILEKYLQYFKVEYVSAINGLEAVRFIEDEVVVNNRDISAILMDCNMPILDGFKASEQINDMLKKTRKNEIPIIAVSANVTNVDIDLCLKSGMKKFLPKPVKRKDLGDMLEEMFKIKF